MPSMYYALTLLTLSHHLKKSVARVLKQPGQVVLTVDKSLMKCCHLSRYSHMLSLSRYLLANLSGRIRNSCLTKVCFICC